RSARSTRTSRFSLSCLRGKIALIITYRLPAGTSTELPKDDGDVAVIGYLREVQPRSVGGGRHELGYHTQSAWLAMTWRRGWAPGRVAGAGSAIVPLIQRSDSESSAETT